MLVAGRMRRSASVWRPPLPRGYSRKGHLQFFMKEHTKALATYELGLQQDPANAELKEGMARCMQAIDRVCPCCLATPFRLEIGVMLPRILQGMHRLTAGIQE